MQDLKMSQPGRRASDSSIDSDGSLVSNSTLGTQISELILESHPSADMITRMINRDMSSVSILHELEQAELLTILEFTDAGRKGDQWTFLVAAGVTLQKDLHCAEGHAAKKNAAKLIAARKCLEKIAASVHTPIVVDQPGGMATAITTSTRQGKQLMEDQSHLRRATMIRMELDDLEHYTVCISLDVEMHELDHSKLLEVGITFLTGDRKAEQSVSSHHLVIRDHLQLHNGLFCPDHREKYHSAFGVSEMVSLPGLVDRIKELITAATVGATSIYLVGHSVHQDVAWLEKHHGVNFGAWDLEVCDIGRLYRSMVSPDTYINIPGMQEIMRQLGIGHEYLHNAGNDARYNVVVLQKLLADIVI